MAAKCNMASAAASGFVLTSSTLQSNTRSSPRKGVAFPVKKNGGFGRRLVLKAAAEEAAPSPPATSETTTTAPAATPSEGEAKPKAAKPPPIGPKRGTRVKILRKESYWFKDSGSVVAVDQDPKTRYPVVVRFNKVNYAGVSTNNYGLDEIEAVK